MDWKTEKPVTLASTLGPERQNEIDDDVCSLLYHFGPDRHIDGHEELTLYICGMITAEREHCAKIAEETAAIADSEQTAGIAYWIADRIRSGEPAI